ncbi:terminase [Acidipila sp. EB88]|uniref:terminase n=1 Tax=Acidipila sp. EB88 TaxID=2305226 RepID=UPI000F5EFD75|nr:terminase [Acidipila sp. EB88]RRA48228.1 terminase [Acidipila sp. EB88]
MGVQDDLDELVRYGRMLDTRPRALGGRSVAAFLAESLLRVRGRDGVVVRLRPNQAQEAFEQRRGQRNVVLKARQMGISTWVSARLFLKTMTVPGTLSVQVAHTQDAAEAIFGMAHRFLQLLPEFLREGALRTSKANAREIYFPMLDSGFRVESASDENAGRGLTITNLHCSEVARWPGDATAVLQGLKAALAPEGELVLESTPQGAQGCFWEEWQRAEETGTVRHFFPWWWERAYVADAVAEESLDEDERRLCEQHGLTMRQIGYRRRLRAGFRELASQEFAEDAESCFAASGDCVFEVTAIDARLREIGEPMARRQHGALLVWLPPAEGRKYLISVDTAGGGAGGDYSVAQVVEIASGLQCAELRAKKTVLEMAQAVATLHREYNLAWVVVERNNHGAGVLAHLSSMMDERRIYRQGARVVTQQHAFTGAKTAVRQGGQEGWLTSSSSRPGMLAILGAMLVEQPELFQSERLLRECRSFVRLPNGRTGAQSGAHDDCVMAMAIAMAVRPELMGYRA